MSDDTSKSETSPSGEIDLAQQELIFVDDGSPSGPDPLLGKIIDNKYKLISKLGSGGMGAVYKGEHTLMGRTVAIKVLHPQFVSNSDLLRRFQHEAQVASRLHHPHAIEIYDYGVYRGAPYIVMQYVEGRTLKDLIQQEGALNFETTRKIIQEFGAALSQAHHLGIIHRDLKPENVMLVKQRDGTESAVLLDFGIAKVLTPEGTNSNATMTRAGTFCGTPKYASPEQVLERPVDHRSDIYTLGIILYEALSGEVPFDAPSFMEILVKHVNEQPKPLLQAKPGLEVPKAVEDIVLRCLKKEPAERFNSLDELLGALRGVSTGSFGEGTQATQLNPIGSEQVRQGASLGLLGGIVGGLLGVAGLAVYLLTSGGSTTVDVPTSTTLATPANEGRSSEAEPTISPPSRRENNDESSQTQNAVTSVALASPIPATEEIKVDEPKYTEPSVAPTIVPDPTVAPTVESTPEPSPIAEPSVAPTMEPSVAPTSADTLTVKPVESGPAPNTEQARKLAVKFFQEGSALYKKKNYAEAAAKFEQAISLRNDAVGSMIALGNCYTRLGRNAEALQRYLAAVRTDPLYGPGHYNLAAFYAVNGRTREAVQSLEKAISLDSRAKFSAREEPDFTSLRSDPEFKRLTGR